MTKKVQENIIQQELDWANDINEEVLQSDILVTKFNKQILELLDIKITSLGAHDSVTWSCTRIDINRNGWQKQSILVDVWLYQSSWDDSNNNQVLPFNPANIDTVILTHQHIDHCGRSPMMVKKETKIKVWEEIWKSNKPFWGTLYTSHTWNQLLRIMLEDSVKVMAKENKEAVAMMEKERAALKELASNLSILNKILRRDKLSETEKQFKRWLLNWKQLRNFDSVIAEIEQIENIFKEAWIQDVKQVDTILDQYKKAIEDKILYTSKEVDTLISMTKWTRFEKYNEILPWVWLVFHKAEHVFGSCIATLFIDDGKWWQVVLGFSWDIWRFYDPKYLNEPDIPPFEYDFMMIEWTYGWRTHVDRAIEEKMLVEFINKVYNRKGKIIIPAFMLQRLQDVANMLVELKGKWLIPEDMDIYFDWWSTEQINNIYKNNDKDWVYKEMFESWVLKSACELGNDVNPFILSQKPAIMLAPSWMYSWGSVTKYNDLLWSKNNAIIFPWFVSQWTPWRLILDSKMNWENEIYLPWTWKTIVNAEAIQLKSLSSHWDQNDLLYFLNWLRLKPNAKICINHWEDESKILLLEEIVTQSVAPRDNVTIAKASETLIFKKPFKSWNKKSNLPKQKQPNSFKNQPENPNKSPEMVLNHEKLEKAIRIIAPNEGFRISSISKNRVHELILNKWVNSGNFILHNLMQSKDPIVRDFLESPFMQWETFLTDVEEIAHIDNTKLEVNIPTNTKLKFNIKEVKEIRNETTILIMISKLNQDTYSWIIRNDNGQIIYKTETWEFEDIASEIRSSWIIPEWLQINKKNTNIKLTRDFYFKKLPILQQIMKQNEDDEKMITDEYIDLRFEEDWKNTICKVIYSKAVIMELKNDSREKIISALKSKWILNSNYKWLEDRVFLNEDNILSVQDIVASLSDDYFDNIIVTPRPKTKKPTPKTEELPKTSKRYTWEKVPRKKKKLVELQEENVVEKIVVPKKARVKKDPSTLKIKKKIEKEEIKIELTDKEKELYLKKLDKLRTKFSELIEKNSKIENFYSEEIDFQLNKLNSLVKNWELFVSVENYVRSKTKEINWIIEKPQLLEKLKTRKAVLELSQKQTPKTENKSKKPEIKKWQKLGKKKKSLLTDNPESN